MKGEVEGGEVEGGREEGGGGEREGVREGGRRVKFYRPLPREKVHRP